MTEYVKATSFSSKDTLPLGNPLKIVKGTEIYTEFNNIATAVATKADLLSPVFTGTPTAATAAGGTNNTQLATTAFATTVSSSTVATSDAAVRPIATGGTGASTASAARTSLGLVIGTDVLAPSGNGSALTALNASALASGTVPVTCSGSLRLMAASNVLSTTGSGTQTVSLPTSLFGNNTPSFVMFKASALGTGGTDISRYTLSSGTSEDISNFCMASSGDDTDQNGSAQQAASATFVLPYASSQNFYIVYGDRITVTTSISVIGYQV